TIPITRLEGITHSAVSMRTGNSVFAGLGAIIDTSGDFDSVLNDRAFEFVSLGERGAEEAGGTRAAAMNQLRGALVDAARRYVRPDDGDALSRSDARALTPVIAGKIPLIIEADRASDILSALSLKKTHKRLNIVILGGAESWMVADAIKAANASVLIDPSESLPYSFAQIGTRLDTPSKLKAAGVRFAFIPRTSDFSHQVRLLPQHAGIAVSNGLPWDDAFKAITLTPAQIYGRADLGTLKIGKTANLVVWDGDPLEVMSAPVRVVIDGERQAMESRQTALASRYNPNNKDTRPHKYRR
ncbi:MAG: amidohydrolase family protein, partial [Robiginitomaculum sp.]